MPTAQYLYFLMQMIAFRLITCGLLFLFLAGCATTKSVVTRPPRFTEAIDSKDGLVLVHDGLPGDRLVLGAEGSSWEFSHAVPHPSESWISGGTAPRMKIARNWVELIHNPEWEVVHHFRSAGEVTTGTAKVTIGMVTMEGESRPFVVHLREADEER